MNKVQQLAKEALGWLDKRNEQVVFKPGTPEWVQDLVREAHRQGGELMLPDDFRFAFVFEVLAAIEEAEDPDEIELEADTYTSRLLAWVSSSLTRPGYVDEVVEELGWPGSLEAALAAGQEREKAEVLQLVLSYLEQLAEDQDMGG